MSSPSDQTTIQPIILSGGSGTRLWPLSREQYPKQLLTLVGEQSLLQATALRLANCATPYPVNTAPIVVSNETYRFVTAEQLHRIGHAPSSLILEPVGRNTAPALALAALAASTDGNDPVMLVMPADHVITDLAAFQRAIGIGAQHAEKGALVTFGIVPTRPETGYGYIRYDRTAHTSTASPLQAFVEKPNADTAKQYVASGEYLWNSGIFMMRASRWQEALKHFRPDIADAAQKAYAGGKADGDFYRVDRSAFEACPSDSIDYAVMEKAPASEGRFPAIVVPLDAGWSDVGAFDALWDVTTKDNDGNATRGDVFLHNTRNTLAYSDSRMLACVGVDNLVIIETPDAILVSDKNHTQDVKHVVARLKQEDRTEAHAHRKIHRPWGAYDSVDAGERFQVKRIIVKPGASLSLQMHHHRAEHWIVVRGTARVTRDDEIFLLGENQSTYIPLGVKHRLENPGLVPLELIEVQSGSYLGEDDIVRFEDTYGRT